MTNYQSRDTIMVVDDGPHPYGDAPGWEGDFSDSDEEGENDNRQNEGTDIDLAPGSGGELAAPAPTPLSASTSASTTTGAVTTVKKIRQYRRVHPTAREHHM